MNKIKILKLFIIYCLMIGLNLAIIFIGDKLPWYVNIIIAEAAIVAPSLIYIKLSKDNFSDIIPFRKIKVGTFFKVILISITATPIYMFVNLLSQFLVPNTIIQASNTMFEGNPIIPFILTCLVAPVCEEIGFRGFFMNELKTEMKVWISVIVSAALFGIMHLNLNQFCYALVLGIVFASVNEASGSIITSMILHCLINLFGTGVLFLQVKLAADLGQDVAQNAEEIRQSGALLSALPVYGVLAALGTVLTVLLIKSIAKHR